MTDVLANKILEQLQLLNGFLVQQTAAQEELKDQIAGLRSDLNKTTGDLQEIASYIKGGLDENVQATMFLAGRMGQ